MEVIKQFNQNIEWLKANRRVIMAGDPDEWIYKNEAAEILNRSESWISTRMMTAATYDSLPAHLPFNANAYLIETVDWIRENIEAKKTGKGRVIFKRESVLRLKKELRGNN